MKINTNYILNKFQQNKPNFGASYMSTDEIAEVLDDPSITKDALRVQEQLGRLSDTVDTLVIPQINHKGVKSVIIRVQDVTPPVADTKIPGLKFLKEFVRAIKIHYFTKPRETRTIFPHEGQFDRNLVETTANLKKALSHAIMPFEAAEYLFCRKPIC